jgi:hypothetical protein
MKRTILFTAAAVLLLTGRAGAEWFAWLKHKQSCDRPAATCGCAVKSKKKAEPKKREAKTFDIPAARYGEIEGPTRGWGIAGAEVVIPEIRFGLPSLKLPGLTPFETTPRIHLSASTHAYAETAKRAPEQKKCGSPAANETPEERKLRDLEKTLDAILKRLDGPRRIPKPTTAAYLVPIDSADLSVTRLPPVGEAVGKSVRPLPPVGE